MSDNTTNPDVQAQVISMLSEYTGIGYASLDEEATKAALLGLTSTLSIDQLAALYPEVKGWVERSRGFWSAVQRVVKHK